MTKFIALLFTMFLAVSSVSAQTETLKWEKDFKKALAVARETGKPLIFVFTKPDCQACQEMDDQYWASEAVVKSVQPFVAVRLNFEQEKPLADKYNVSEVPFVGFTDPLGNLMSSLRGFNKDAPRKLNNVIRNLPRDFSSLERAYQAVERKKDDGAALLEIADSYRSSGLIYLSTEFYKKAAKTPEINNNPEKKERVAFALGVNPVSYQDYKEAIDNLEDYLKNYPTGAYRETAITLLVVSNANLEKFSQADKYFAQLKAEFPNSKNIPIAVKSIETAKNKRAKR